MYRVILKNTKVPDREVIVLSDGIKSEEYAQQMRINWRRVLGGKNWTVERRPNLDTIDHLGLTIERYGRVR